MSSFLITIGLAGLLYGIFRPESVLPHALGEPSPLKAVLLYGVIAVLGAAGLRTPETEGLSAEPVALAETTGVAGWPGGEEARDSAFLALQRLVEEERYAEAEDEAEDLSRQPYAGEWADSLRLLAQTAEELAIYAEARRLPASELERNREAYSDLARRFPNSPRIEVYTQKREDYSQRVVDRDNARLNARYRAPRQTTACCRRCSRGKPCGDSCIARNRTCRKGPGCAC